MGQSPGPLRALIDTNLLVSALLSSDPDRSAAAAVLFEANQGTFSLVVPPEALEEVARVVASKPWLASRIAPHEVESLLRGIATVAEVPQRLSKPPPRICRDPGDDYLIAQAVLARVDLLISRDQDLLALAEAAGVRIVDPVTFLELLRLMEQ